jgi:hypothetical protein
MGRSIFNTPFFLDDVF